MTPPPTHVTIARNAAHVDEARLPGRGLHNVSVSGGVFLWPNRSVGVAWDGRSFIAYWFRSRSLGVLFLCFCLLQVCRPTR